jgi:glycerol-3-phosphate dehydrogenase
VAKTIEGAAECSNPVYDLLVMGGGIAGLGVALVAAQAGLKTAMLERRRLGQGVSAHSLRIMHGGFRYLQSLDVPRILESARAQAELLRVFPNHFASLPCLLPLEPWSKTGPLPLAMASGAYRVLGLLTGGQPPSFARWSAQAVAKELPYFSSLAPQGAFQWMDYRLRDHDAFVEELRQRYLKAGGDVFEDSEIYAVDSSSSKGFEILCQGEIPVFRTARLVNALGPQQQAITARSANTQSLFSSIQHCLGFNLLLKGLPGISYGLAARFRAGRYFFLSPREESCALGTWYTERFDRTNPEVSSEALKKALQDAQMLFPELPITARNISGIEFGLLPYTQLSASGEAVGYGRTEVRVRGAYGEFLTTKYTTFLPAARRMLGALGIACSRSLDGS